MNLSFEKPLLMGILNITPDSFSDGGNFLTSHEAIHRVKTLLQEGADIIDIGAESTFGPESQVTAEEEWRRLEPVLTALSMKDCHSRLPPNPFDSFAMTVLSLDTWKAEVAERGLKMGVRMINDVTALRGDPRMMEILMEYHPYVCLMYSAYETPYAGREHKQYEDVVETIKKFLGERTKELMNRGFPREKILIDPGLGFFLSADPKYSWEVIERLNELKELGFPILIGPSMKSFLGGEIKDRLPKSLEAAKKCLENGASVLRVHHVKEHQNMYNQLTKN